ncbi:unnamed protein product [Durusdinium trenchii]|uniref:THH1/TOM1/TOM3 domain-containing protein n=1 Tax=Durusdinium trenchii TaxID=1381693 RepID=A0ABP0SNC0_9DINO
MAPPWQPAPVADEPNTMSLEELHRSRVLVTIDVVLFFGSALVASKFWIDTQIRIRDLRRVNHDPNALASRRLCLQLLALANALRALGLVLDAKFRSIFGKATHGRYEQDHGAQQYVDWHRFFDYIISSFPTLVWCSMLSVLLLHILELHLAWRRSSSRACRACLRPWFFLGNLLAYVLYAACVAVTLPRRYAAFRHGAYFLLGCTHVLLVSGLLYFGYAVKKKVHQLEGSDLLSRRMWLLALVPLTELVRTVNDFEYSLGFLPFNLDSGLSSFLFLALAKLFLEWLPSACILIVFQPSQRRHASPGARAEDLVNPLLPPKPFDQKPEVESSESEEDTRGTLGPPEGIPWSLRVTCGSPRCGLSEREWKAMGVDEYLGA